MTTLTRPEAAAGGQPPVVRPPAPERRTSGWRSSWRVALRLARRDVRRHRGRSLVVLLMVGLPTMLLCAALTVAATSQVTGAEVIPAEMGAAQASLRPPVQETVVQGPDATRDMGSGAGQARPVPGYDTDGTPFDNAPAISRLVGGTAVPWVEEQTRLRVGDRTRLLPTLAVADPSGLGDKVELLSGRWPAAPGEVLLSEWAVDSGITGTRLTSAPTDGTATDLEVVGTVRAHGPWGVRYDLVTTTPQAGNDEGGGGWLLQRESPVSWQEVRRLNGYGIAVTSAAVLRDPPAPDEIDPLMQQLGDCDDRRASVAVALAGVLLLLVTTLLVGPAFAVGAARQRRTLALAAANGATTPQLRRAVLGQAVVLGGLSAVLGAVLGLAAATAFVAAADSRRWMSPAPLDIPWWQLAAIVAMALASSVIAALLPATRLGRLDIVSAMRGQHSAPPPSRAVLVLGALLATVGAVGVIAGARASAAPGPVSAEIQVVLGTLALVLGSLLVVPTVLHLLGRVGGRLPLPLRLATRDLARHRSRSAPTVAAVLAGTAALTMGLVGASSDTEQQRREYQPRTLTGEVLVQGGPMVVDDAALARYRRTVPGVELVTVGSFTPAVDDPTEPQSLVVLVPSGCRPEQAVRGEDGPPDDAGGEAEQVGSGCLAIGDFSSTGRAITVLPAAEIIRRLGLEGDEAARVRDGGGALLTLPTDRGVVADGQVRLARLRASGDPWDPATTLRTDQQATLPVVTRPYDGETTARSLQSGLLVPAEAAAELRWPVTARSITGHVPGGAVPEDVAERLRTEVGEEGDVVLERGFVNPLGIVIGVLLGVFTFLLLVVTLTSTGLSLAEQENDQATLAAVGAGRGTRRLMVAGQALALSLLGVVLGIAVGLVPGIAIAYPLTGMQFDPITGAGRVGDPIIVIPWAVLAVMALVVPLVAAALAALAVRRAPDATRRRRL